MKVPIIEQDVQPTVQTSQALSLGIERREEIPTVKSGAKVFAALQTVADAATGIGDKMREADMLEEYLQKKTTLVNESKKIMTDIQTDPNYRNYTNDQLFTIYDDKSKALQDSLFTDVKWPRVKEKLNSDYSLYDVNNRTDLQVEGWKNTITRGVKNLENSLTASAQEAGTTNDSARLAQIISSANETIKQNVGLGIITPEQEVAVTDTFRSNAINGFMGKQINDQIRNGVAYKDAYNNINTQLDAIGKPKVPSEPGKEPGGWGINPLVIDKLKQEANTAYRQRFVEDVGYLNKEGTDVCTLYVIDGTNRYKQTLQKFETFGDKNLTADFKRNWEIALAQREKSELRQKENVDNQLLASSIEFGRRTGSEMPGTREQLLSGVKPGSENWKDINMKIDVAINTGRVLGGMKVTTPDQDLVFFNGRDEQSVKLANSTNPDEQRAYSYYQQETAYLQTKANEKYKLLSEDPYKYVTDQDWRGLAIPVQSKDELTTDFQKRLEPHFKAAEEIQMQMGLPKDRVRYMSTAQAKQDVSKLTQSDATTVGTLLQNKMAYYGTRYPSVEKQYLDNGAPPAFQVLSFSKGNPVSLQRSLDLFGTTETKLKESAKSMDPNLNNNQFEMEIKKEIKPYLSSVALANLDQPGLIDDKTNGLVKGLNMYAYSLKSSGYDTKDAIKESTNLVNSKYDFKSTYIINKEFNSSTISSQLGLITLQDLPKMDLYKPYSSPADKEITLANARWVTDNSDTYAVLTRSTGDPVRKADGSLIKYRFVDLLEMSYYREPLKGPMMTLPEIMNQGIPKE
jgi:hypothetical protein